MIKKLFLIAFIVFSVKVSVADQSNTVPPVLENFRIKASEPDRIYFDSSEPITASTVTGFILNDITITNVSINSDQLLNHYFTVSSSFKWFNHNSIRYTGGSNFENQNSIALAKFDLQYIENKIVPIEGASNIFYVNASVNSSGDGSSEANAFKTIQEAANVAAPGSKIWIKAGNYGAEKITFPKGGKSSNPIVFEGYKEQTGDITSMYYNYGDGNLDANEMPLLDGGNRGAGIAIFFKTKSFIIIRNIQITNYKNGIKSQSLRGIILENILIKSMGNKNSNRGKGIHFDSATNNASYSKIKNCTIINSTLSAFMMGGRNNLIENCKAYSNEANYFNDIYATTDYYFILRGSNNIIRNSYAHKDTPNGAGHLGHGFALKASDQECEYNLIELNTSVNIYGAFEARHPETKFNVFKDLVSHADVPNRRASKTGSAAVNILQGAESNIFERIYGHHLDVAIRFGDNTEDNTHVSGKNNIIKNCVFDNVKAIILASNVSRSTTRPTGNKVYNNTFNNANYLFRIYDVSDPVVFSNNKWKNNIFNNIRALDDTRYASSSGWSYSNNNFYDGFSKPSGSGNTSVDPKFENLSTGNFKLAQDSPLIDSGLDINGIILDFEKNSRLQGSGIDVGAYEYEDSTVSAINANAGSDVEICSGEQAVLTATGNGDFLWSTGETTASITISPVATTTYSVTVTDTNTNQSETDDVIVTVQESPSVTLSDDFTICLGENIVLTATGVGDFLWSTGETTASITINPTTTTNYSVTASNFCSTTATDDITVTVNSGVNLDAGNDITICLGESITLSASSTGDFLWSTGETTANIIVSPTATTTYTVTSTLGSCSATDEVTVTVSDSTSVTLGDDITLCSGGGSVTLTAEGTGNFLWSTGETTASIIVNPTITTTYSVTASSSCSTDVTDEITVTVNSGVNLDAGNDITICSGNSVTLSANSTGDFLWSTGETTANIIVSPATTTTYTVTSTLGSCLDTDEVTVTVTDSSSVTLGDDIFLCSGEESVTLTAEGAGDFLWSTGETTASIVVNPTATTTYSVTASSSCSTNATDEITVNVNSGVNLDAGNDVAICLGDSTTLSANSTGDFLWNTGETTANIIVSPTTTTTYMVTSTLGGCSVIDEVTVTVTVTDSPTVTLGDDITLCSGEESVTLTAEGTGNFLWSTGETTASIIVYPTSTTTYTVSANSCNTSVTDEITVNVTGVINLDAGEDVQFCPGESVTLTAEGTGDFLWSTGESTASITVTPNETTTYTVSSSVGSCVVTDQVIAMITPSPFVNITSNDIIVCSTEEEIVLIAEGMGTFLWNTGETTSSITVHPTVTDTYSVTITNSCGEVAEDEVLISVNEPVTAYAGEDIIINEGYSVVLTASGGDEYLWSTGETTESITIQPTIETIYYVEVSRNGCSDVDDVKVSVDEAVVMINNGLDITICSGEEVSLEAYGGINYLWDTGEITSVILAKPEKTTTYYVSGMRDGEIQTAEITINVDDCSGDSNNRISNLEVYPNPTEGIINIFLPDLRAKVKLSLVSLNGSLIYNKEVKADSNGVFTQIDLSSMAKGVYFLRMYNENFNETKKILVI